MAISGECSTPAINPAIPTRVKLAMGKSCIPATLTILAKLKPMAAPINSEGANTPPIPPPAKVKEVANTFKKPMASTKRITT